MSSYPIQLNLEGRRCLVVGGGRVGQRKLAELITCGAEVTLVDPGIPRQQQPGLNHLRADFAPEQLAGMFLVFAATDRPEVNAEVVSASRERGLLVCRADAPQQGDFSLPARRRRGDICLSVATEGRSPALAALLAEQLCDSLGDEWLTLLELAAALRQSHLTAGSHTQYNQRVLHKLITAGLPGFIRAADRVAIDRLLVQYCGPGCHLANLGIDLPKA